MIHKTILFLFICCFSFLSKSSEFTFYDNRFAEIPILSNGRIKPLDTFARTTLRRFHNKDKLQTKEAIQWLAEVVFNPEMANQKRFFRIVNTEILKTLSLIQDSSNNYSPLELISCFQINSKLIEELSATDQNLLTETQKQILELYSNVQLYIELSRSFSLYFKDFLPAGPAISTLLRFPVGEKISYHDILNHEADLKIALTAMIKRGGLKNPKKEDKEILEVVSYIDYIRQDGSSAHLKILPPLLPLDQEWISPWSAHNLKNAQTKTNNLLSKWNEIIESYRSNNSQLFNKRVDELFKYTFQFPLQNNLEKLLKLETLFNRLDLFTHALTLYVLSFILFFSHFLFFKKHCKLFSLTSLGLGSILHLTGIVMRCMIMNRPPVSSLYESILFVAFIAVFGSLLIEWFYKNGNGLFIGSTLGAILLFISFGYEKDGDSMGMLVAVLDTNFWLATHVVTISIGYGCSLVAALLAHLYLFRKAMAQSKRKEIKFAAIEEKSLLNNIHGTVLFSLFFTVLGTILGGIWADQSWGRFWGWDPKENGALFLCLWLLLIVHGKLAGYFKKISFALAASLTSIIVILAWFGVNLLNVGLHSYGFTDSIAQNIMLFILIESLILGLLFYWCKWAPSSK